MTRHGAAMIIRRIRKAIDRLLGRERAESGAQPITQHATLTRQGDRWYARFQGEGMDAIGLLGIDAAIPLPFSGAAPGVVVAAAMAALNPDTNFTVAQDGRDAQ